MLGNIIGGISSLIGGAMGSSATKDANEAARAANELAYQRAERDKEIDREYQERFARSGIQWRVEDAKAAGIHPLYALGANTSSYSGSPIQVGSPSVAADTSMASAVSSFGQDIGRAVNSTRTQSQRDEAFVRTTQDLQLRKMGLENELLASQIKRMQVSANPAFPSSGPNNSDLRLAGVPIKKDPSTSDMQDFSDRYGDEGLAQWTIPPWIMWRDYQATTGGRGPDTSSWPSRVGSAVWEGLKWADKNIKVFGPPARREWTNPR